MVLSSFMGLLFVGLGLSVSEVLRVVLREVLRVVLREVLHLFHSSLLFCFIIITVIIMDV